MKQYMIDSKHYHEGKGGKVHILLNYPVYYLPAKELLTKSRHVSKLKTGGSALKCYSYFKRKLMVCFRDPRPSHRHQLRQRLSSSHDDTDGVAPPLNVKHYTKQRNYDSDQ